MLQKMVVNKETVTEAYRIVQEALGNVFRHAKATQAKISISLKNDKLFISVQDNGVGIQVNRLDDKSALGILGMRERASIVGGTIRIASNPGKGTTVRISIPL
jgi:signal transduction histidine kinase